MSNDPEVLSMSVKDYITLYELDISDFELKGLEQSAYQYKNINEIMELLASNAPNNTLVVLEYRVSCGNYNSSNGLAVATGTALTPKGEEK